MNIGNHTYTAEVLPAYDAPGYSFINVYVFSEGVVVGMKQSELIVSCDAQSFVPGLMEAAVRMIEKYQDNVSWWAS